MQSTAPARSLERRTREILAAHDGLEGPLLPILHAVQEEFGHIPQQAQTIIADRLNLSRAEVHGVVSFYPDFRDHPSGRHSLKICRAEACQARGGEALGDHARHALKVDWHETTADGAVTLEPVYCLGLCANGPAALVDGAVTARLDTARLDVILDTFGLARTAP